MKNKLFSLLKQYNETFRLQPLRHILVYDKIIYITYDNNKIPKYMYNQVMAIVEEYFEVEKIEFNVINATLYLDIHGNMKNSNIEKLIENELGV